MIENRPIKTWQELVREDQALLRKQWLRFASILGGLLLLVLLWAAHLVWRCNFPIESRNEEPFDPGFWGRFEFQQAVDGEDGGRIKRLVYYGSGFLALTSTGKLITMVYGDDLKPHVLRISTFTGDPKDVKLDPVPGGV